MKNLNTILLIVLTLAVGYLFYNQSSSNKNSPAASGQTDTEGVHELKLAFINMDSLNSQYTFIADKTEELEVENLKIQSRIQNELKKIENRQAQLQKQLPSMTQAQFESAEAEMQKLQYDFQVYQNDQAQIIQNFQLEFQEVIMNQLDSFLTPYRVEYDFIYTIAVGSELLHGKDQYDITKDILEKMNAAYTVSKENDVTLETIDKEK